MVQRSFESFWEVVSAAVIDSDFFITDVFKFVDLTQKKLSIKMVQVSDFLRKFVKSSVKIETSIFLS